MRIEFYKHAKLKFVVLRECGFKVTEDDVTGVVKNPRKVTHGYRYPRMVAEGGISETHDLRVIYEKHHSHIMVVTFYPRRRKHEDKL